jgi:hypothetical protein
MERDMIQSFFKFCMGPRAIVLHYPKASFMNIGSYFLKCLIIVIFVLLNPNLNVLGIFGINFE